MFAHVCFLFSMFFVDERCMFRIAPPWVADSTLARQYGIEWAVCIRGVGESLSLVAPSFASSSPISLPMISIRALTFCKV